MIDQELETLKALWRRHGTYCDPPTSSEFESALHAVIGALEKLDERITRFEYRELHKSTSDNP